MRTTLLTMMIAILTGGSAAAETSLFGGAGARFADAGTSAVGAVRATFGVGPLVSLAGEIHGYFGGPAAAPAVDLAGGQLGLVADLPIPGSVGVEVGGYLGYHSLSVERHGVDDSAVTLNLEAALVFDLGPADLRVSYAHAVWSFQPAPGNEPMTGQLLFALGVGL